MHMRYYVKNQSEVFTNPRVYQTDSLDDLLSKIKVVIEHNYHLVYVDFGGQVLFDS